ncbi:uncharacterized protein LOC111946916 [Oryzias latipes]|uniref:uncharacterized protein LOC111946916 n=1 Tax=Oryzias latipes TaxID=8090 RepID=UPI000CE18637|nr:uncharacterized protein LOC111946916 [Oryzias latipes]
MDEKNAAVKKLGACRRCLEVHDDCSFCNPAYLCKNQDCMSENMAVHHFCLCPKVQPKKSEQNQKRSKEDAAKSQSQKKYTQEQEEFFSKLSPELAEQCRDVFSNTASRALNSTKEPSLLQENGLKEFPVIMMLLTVTANAGQKIGALIDLASDTNYITHKAASKLNLRSENITLIVHGVGGMKAHVETKRYLLKIRVMTPKGTLKSHQIVCYGLENIADIQNHVTAEQLQKFFPDVQLAELERPREIQLLISHREGQIAPQKVKSVGNLVLWDGPLGKTVGGTHPKLFEGLTISAHMSKTHFARSMRTAAARYEEVVHSKFKDFSQDVCTEQGLQNSSTATTFRDFLEWWKWDSVGAACVPKCGGCRCGNCQPGGKEMTLAEERELQEIKEGLTYTEGDSHSSEPHWHAKYPWVEDPAFLPNNRRAVEATFFRTERQLNKDPEWKLAYTVQVHDMVERKAAMKRTNDIISGWTGPVWYISHLVAPNPHSATTPIRLVWNSSQRFKGVCLNDLLMKGPDVLNLIPAVLLRFRCGVYAALGDVRKMYNSVWLEDKEMHLHRFLWRDSEERELQEYAITRVNMGDKPAGCIAQLAMRETANLPAFTQFEEERNVIQRNSYVDDIFVSHNNPERLKAITDKVEQILKSGGFELKPWVFSGQGGKSQGGRQEESHEMEKPNKKPIILPNQISQTESKALGLVYDVIEDKLHILTAINFSKKKMKMRLGQDLSQDQIRPSTPNPLTRRELLSQVSGLYDPLGLGTPIKQKGAIIVRKAFQEAKDKKCPVDETWDMALSDDLREEAISLFEEYVKLAKIKFPRALTPGFFISDPVAVTFCDGSEQAYGAVMYLRWETEQGLVDVKRFSCLTRLIKTVAWMWRAAKRFGGKNKTMEKLQWEAVTLAGIISVKEREDALRDIFLAAQENMVLPATTTDRLVVYKNEESGLLVCGGRIQVFRKNKVGVPILPHDAWVSTLLAREAHNQNHEGIAATLLRLRTKAWVIKGRRIVKRVVDDCLICRKEKSKNCQQIMSSLPPERIEPAAPFQFTTIDLFGPYQVREDVKKRVTQKVWGVLFCCMASRAIHAEIANDLSTEGFLMAYQRFTAIRGHPRKIWSDPGTNFVGA